MITITGKTTNVFTVQQYVEARAAVTTCIKSHMSLVDTQTYLAIDPSLTARVWKKMEHDNAQFFATYNTQLILKDQINIFNKLIKAHVHLCDHYVRTKIKQ